MTRLNELPARVDDESVRVVVESPKRSRLKMAFCPEHETFEVERELVLGVAFPYDFGFVPSTLAEDGDPLDAMVLGDSPGYPGVVVRVRLVGPARVRAPGPKGKRR